MEEAVKAALLQGIQTGEVPTLFVARVEKFRKREGDIFAAIEKASAEEAKEQEAMEAEELPPELPEEPSIGDGMTPAGVGPPGGLPPGPAPGTDLGIGPSADQQGVKQLINAVTAGQEMI